MMQRLIYPIAVLLAGLIFVWPIEHTIALRYSLGGLLLVATVFWAWPQRRELFTRLQSRPVSLASLFLGSLTLWFVAQGMWIAPEAHWVWQELRGQWIKDLLFWSLGIMLGVGCLHSNATIGRTWLSALLAGLSGIVLWNVFVCLWLWLSTGHMPLMHSVTGARATDSYVNNMLLAFLVGDLLARDHAQKFLPWGRAVSIALVVFCVINTAFIGARNGWIGLGMLTFSGVIVHYINGWQRVGKKALIFLPVLLVLLAAGAWTSWKTDPRWNSLKETLPVAWDIDTNKAWLNVEKYPYPTLPNGQVADASNYERPAWIHAGLRLIANRPLGAGFSRHAFGHELARVYPESEPGTGGHSHSGMIDFAVAAGIPGVVLWMGFILTLITFGGIAYFRYGAAAGLVLVFLTSGFFGRSLLDSSMRDHMLEQFLFVAAFLLPTIGRFWQKAHIMSQTRILIVRRDNIGDLICTLPFISAIRQLNQTARIDLLVNSYCAPVVVGNPDLDHVYIYTKAKHKESGESTLGVYWRRLLLTLKLRLARYDWLVLANVSCQPRPLRWAKQVGAKHIVGFTETNCKGAETITNPVPLIRGQGKHEVEYLMALLQPFGSVGEIDAARIAPDPALQQRAQAMLASARSFGKPLIGINLSARLSSQQWPAEKFIELVHLLKNRYHCVLFWAPGSASSAGHPGDDEKAAEVAAPFSENDLSCLPTQQLGELVAGIACVDLLVTADGGALHIGAACGKPEVVMFGDSDSTQWYPWRVPFKLLHPVSRDVRSIAAADVAAAVDQLVNEK